MNQFLTFIVLVVLCTGPISCVKLENLCSADSFTYKDVEVNAFYRVQQNLTSESFGHYLIDHTICDPSEFRNKSNFWEALKIRNRYNRKFAESYTKDLNGATIDEFKDIANKIYVNAKRPLFKMKQNEPNAQCLEIFFRTSDLGHSLFSLLRDVFEQNCNPINDDADFTPKSGAFFKMFEKLFDELKTGSDEMKTFALKSERAFDVFFDSEIVRPREFKFLTEGSDRVQPDTKSMLIFDQFFPFNNKNHVDTNCVPVEELPLFYKKKGSHR